MRLWSIHPQYLDAKGLVACWREGLLARKVLLGETKGYRDHPQLERFKACRNPVAMVDTYLSGILEEALERNYSFDRKKIGPKFSKVKISVTEGQLLYEFEHLRSKLAVREPERLSKITNVILPETHPIFVVTPGGVADWERVSVT